MTREKIKQDAIKIIQENLPEFKNQIIDETTRINTSKGRDSRTFIYVRCKIESFFDIKIPEKKWQKRQTLKDRIDSIEIALRKKA